MTNSDERPSGASRRGFASMDPVRQREIARQGGASVPADSRSFSKDRSLAREAGRKGGIASAKGQKGFMDRDRASAAGAKSKRPRPQDDFGLRPK